MMYPASGRNAWWICPSGHSWRSRIADRTSAGLKCPECFGKSGTGTENLEIEYPEIASFWDFKKNKPLKPENVRSKSGKKVHWICQKGHTWEARIADITRRSIVKCPVCKGNENLLVDRNPKLYKQLHKTKNINIDLNKLKASSNKVVWWQCELGHEWEATVYNRFGNETGCPYCSGRSKAHELD